MKRLSGHPVTKRGNIVIIIVIIIIIINCSWVVTRWQWLFDTYTKYDIGLLLSLRREGYM